MKKIMLIIAILLFSFSILPKDISAAENAKVIGDFVTVRKSASNSAGSITKVIYGTDVIILGEENGFYKINYDGKNTGYMSKTYVKKLSEYTINDNAYCTQLIKQGFDISYCPYLSYLHKLHPNWIFAPLVTNLDFYGQVVDGEEGKNCIQSTNDNYRASSKSCDAGGWYTVNQTVNAYMLDPRNFLMEKTIFMFENLGYTERKENAQIVSNIFGSTSYLNTTKDNGASYIDYYVDAGKTYKVSPVHLAARTKQEGGANADYAPITGTVTSTLPEYGNRTLKGFYNYYNIGASNGGNPQLKGLAYAAGYNGKTGVKTSYGRPWNTRKKAIYGGADFIAGSYISAGQSTPYFQKFNTNPNATNSLYTHQYMSNIFAPYSEGLNVRNSYEKNNLLNLSHTFLIPVYKNMPTATKQATLLNGTNALSNIYINNAAISDFDSDILEYTLYYLDSVTKFTIEANSLSVDAKIEGTGVYEITAPSNTITIKVTAENGTTKVYKLHIHRVKDTTTVEAIIAKLDVKSKSNYLYGISSNTAVSTIISSVQKMSPSAMVKITQSNGVEKKTGVLATGDKLVLKTLTSNQVTYELAVNGDTTGDGKVDIKDLLRTQKHLLGTSKLTGVYQYAADTNNDSKLNVQDLLRIQKHILGSVTL